MYYAAVDPRDIDAGMDERERGEDGGSHPCTGESRGTHRILHSGPNEVALGEVMPLLDERGNRRRTRMLWWIAQWKRPARMRERCKRRETTHLGGEVVLGLPLIVLAETGRVEPTERVSDKVAHAPRVSDGLVQSVSKGECQTGLRT